MVEARAPKKPKSLSRPRKPESLTDSESAALRLSAARVCTLLAESLILKRVAREPEVAISELSELLSKLQSLRQSELPGDAPAVLDAVDTQLKGQGRELRKARHDFRTIVEVTKRLNSQGLDLQRIETFVNRLLMGQFAAAKTYFLREGDFDDGVFRCQRDSRVDFRFAYESPFVAWVLGLQRPFVVSEHERELSRFGIRDSLARHQIEVISPLVRHEQDRRLLEGLLFLGQRITVMPFDERDLEFLGLVSDLVAIALHNASLFFASTHDALTKIYGRGHFDMTIDQELQRALRYDDEARQVSLAMVDIDHFKRFNDTYGHAVGDEVLRQVARTLADTVRKIDVVARYGGEEFAVIFPEIRKQEARIAAERIRSAIENLRVQVDGVEEPLSVTVSIGIATFPEDADERQALINRADQALYCAKEEARNCVVLAGNQS